MTYFQTRSPLRAVIFALSGEHVCQYQLVLRFAAGFVAVPNSSVPPVWIQSLCCKVVAVAVHMADTDHVSERARKRGLVRETMVKPAQWHR